MTTPIHREIRRALPYWAVVGLWLVVISTLSADPFSAQNTHRYIDPILRWLFPELTAAGFALAHTLIRKTAHFVEFFILGLLVFWAIRRGRPPSWRWQWSAQAVAFSALWALVDEFHQSFVLSRTASLWDSAIDTLGALMSQVALCLGRTPTIRPLRNSTAQPNTVHRPSLPDESFKA